MPVLWDKKRGCIVNNESSEIIRMFNSERAGFVRGCEGVADCCVLARR